MDTNVIVSGLMAVKTPPALIVRAWRRDELAWIMSAPLFDEIADLVQRRWLRERLGWNEDDIRDFLADIEESTIWVKPRQSIAVCRDPNDDKFIEAAVAGEADFIVSGDRDLLAIGAHDGVAIVTPGRFLAELRR